MTGRVFLFFLTILLNSENSAKISSYHRKIDEQFNITSLYMYVCRYSAISLINISNSPISANTRRKSPSIFSDPLGNDNRKSNYILRPAANTITGQLLPLLTNKERIGSPCGDVCTRQSDVCSLIVVQYLPLIARIMRTTIDNLQ